MRRVIMSKKKKKFSYYILISIISSIVFILIGLFAGNSVLLPIIHFLFLNAILSGSIFKTVYIQNFEERKKRMFFIFYLILAIGYVVYNYNQPYIPESTYITMILVNILQLFDYFN